jgi:hypothetical protein
MASVRDEEIVEKIREQAIALHAPPPASLEAVEPERLGGWLEGREGVEYFPKQLEPVDCPERGEEGPPRLIRLN